MSDLWLHYFKNEKYCKNFVLFLSYQFTSVKVSYLRRKVLKMKQKDIKIKTSNIKLCKKLDNFDRTNYHRWYVKSRATSTATNYGNKLTLYQLKAYLHGSSMLATCRFYETNCPDKFDELGRYNNILYIHFLIRWPPCCGLLTTLTPRAFRNPMVRTRKLCVKYI